MKKIKLLTSESFLLLQGLALVVTQDLKPKKCTETNTKRLQHGLRKKMNIFELSEFSILPNTQNRKLGNLRNFVYL